MRIPGPNFSEMQMLPNATVSSINIFKVFGNIMKLCLSCLIYYLFIRCWPFQQTLVLYHEHTRLSFNPFSASQLSTTNFSLYNTYKIWHLVMRKWEVIKQSQLLKIKSQILSNLFNEKYGLRLGEFINTTGNERVNTFQYQS